MKCLPLLSILAAVWCVSCAAFVSTVATRRVPGPVVWAAEETSSSAAEEPVAPAVKCPDCDLCDGSGRIAGGLGAVVPWIPIKAYRPCPNFIARGGNYERSGQGLDEIAFGRDSTFKKNN